MRPIALLLLVLPAATVSFAGDDGQSNRQVKYAERTEIDFTGIELVGELVKPPGFIVTEPTGLIFEPMVPLRDNFTTEMQQSIDAVK